MMSRIAPLFAAALLAGCGIVHAETHSGGDGTRSFNARGFDRVSLRGSDNVLVRVGAAESVNASGPSEVLDKLQIEVVDGELRVGRERGAWNWSWGKGPRGNAVVTVTVPKLRAASVAGSGDMQVDRADAGSFSASVAGSGNLTIGALRADAASLDVAGSGNAKLGGSARSINVSVAGSGNLDLAGLAADRAKINVAGSGDVSARVKDLADVSIVGSGDVNIIGRPRCEVSKMGSGSVRCGDS